MAHYLYEVNKWKEFKFSKFLINIFLAWFVWYVIWEFLPHTFELRDSFIAMSGFSAFPILSYIENKFPQIFENMLNNKK